MRAAGIMAMAIWLVSSASGEQPAAAPADDLAVALSLDPGSLDPRIVWSIPGMGLVYQMYDKFLLIDEKGTLIPELATSWQWTNPTMRRFQLRCGVTFHTGEAFTAESVKYTLGGTIAPESKSPHKSFLNVIDSVQVVDDYTVGIKTKTPARPLLLNLTYTFVVPAKAGGAMGKNLATKAVGAGPYKLVEYPPGQRVVMERFEGY